MASSANHPTPSLRDDLAAALPLGSNFYIRYIYSRSKRCQPLFSPVLNDAKEKTTLSSHFLTVSIPSADDAIQDVFIYAVEVLVYTTANLTTLFVSKADTTGYLGRSSKPSSVRIISTTFLRWLSHYHRAMRPGGKQVISLFGRAQGQYLFPGSAENGKKHVLDDRRLIKWWVSVLDPLFRHLRMGEAARRGFITVPGYRGIELRQFLPPSREHWTAGHPLRELAGLRNVSEAAPTRCLLPRFPDDPKARFMQDLDDEVGLAEDAGALASTLASPTKRKDGRWKAIHDLDRFWEAMEFRQECSSGRVVGFLWLVTDYESSSNDDRSSRCNPDDLFRLSTPSQATAPSSQQATRKKRKKGKLTGIIVARSPRIKGSSNRGTATDMDNRFDGNGVCLTTEGYEQAMQTLLHLDYSSLDVATISTRKWVAEVASICHLPKQSWTLELQGQATTERVLDKHQELGNPVNDLAGVIKRRKRALNDYATTTGMDSDSQEKSSVNVLEGSLIRKKSKVQ